MIIKKFLFLFLASIIYSFESFVLPLFAILIMNQEWKFNINFLNLEYKPWRLYLFACSIPNLICAAVLQFYLLESPKYTFSRGNEAETLMILRKIFRMNTGKSILEYDVREIKKNEEYGSTLTMNKGFFTTFWKQSIPLFQGKLLRHILTACFLQFSMCLVCNGFWVFLPEIINQINLFIDSNPVDQLQHVKYSICIASNQTPHIQFVSINLKLELSSTSLK